MSEFDLKPSPEEGDDFKIRTPIPWDPGLGDKCFPLHVGYVVEKCRAIGKVFAVVNVDKELTYTYIAFIEGQEPIQDYKGCWELCDNPCEVMPTGYIITEGPLCGLPIFFQPKLGECVIFNPETKCYEPIDMSTKIGANLFAFTVEERPFTCEIPAPVGGGNVTVTNADIIASLAGATFMPSGLPADDAANVYLSDIEGVLTMVNDEAEGGFVASTCQAVATDVQTGKTKDIEPGGNYAAAVRPGYDVPEFSVEIEEGSNMVFCGKVTQRIDKSNEVMPK